jgi:hypothetical protein
MRRLAKYCASGTPFSDLAKVEYSHGLAKLFDHGKVVRNQQEGKSTVDP